MISIISIEFLFLVVAVFFLYFIFPIKYRWIVLLVFSLYVYSRTGILNMIFVLITAGIARLTTCTIEKIYGSEEVDRKKAKKVLTTGISLLILILFITKTGKGILRGISVLFAGKEIDFQIIVPLGISYYTFSLIGYMADVYWKKEAVEHNYLKLLLYMLYFPHILQGPIPRHKRLTPQLLEGHPFRYQNLCFGLQRMIWGYFKKMVIADRLAMLTREVFGNYTEYEGLVFIVAAFCSAIELYCDFSGCMDIVIGISEAMSIKLDENFQRPFFSKSAAEFWRRWHITLGMWFRDYVYMPLSINSKLIKFCQKAKKKFGNRFARNLLTIIALSVVWILTGLWHSTGWNYIVWGCYWGIIIIVSTVCAPEMKKLAKKFKINTESRWYAHIQVVQTFILFLISRLLTAPGDIRITWEILCRIFSRWNPEIFINQTLYTIGLDRWDFWAGVIAILILWGVECLQEKGIKMRTRIASYPIPLRWGIYYAGILSIYIFGIYGSGVGKDTFIYMNF